MFILKALLKEIVLASLRWRRTLLNSTKQKDNSCARGIAHVI